MKLKWNYWILAVISGKDSTMKLTLVLITLLSLTWVGVCEDHRPPNDVDWNDKPLMRAEGPPREHLERMLDRIAEKDPEAAEKLRQLHEEDPDVFREEMREYMAEHSRKMMPGRSNNRERMRNPKHGGRDRSRMQKRHEQYIEWLQENYPAEAAELAEVRDRNPQLYIRRLTRSMKKYGKAAHASKDNPELAAVLREDIELKDQRNKILDELKTTDPDTKEALKVELNDVVNQRFDLIVKRKQVRHERLLKKLEELKKHVEKSEAEVETWEQSKQEKVNARVEELLKESEKIQWD